MCDAREIIICVNTTLKEKSKNNKKKYFFSNQSWPKMFMAMLRFFFDVVKMQRAIRSSIFDSRSHRDLKQRGLRLKHLEERRRWSSYINIHSEHASQYLNIEILFECNYFKLKHMKRCSINISQQSVSRRERGE